MTRMSGKFVERRKHVRAKRILSIHHRLHKRKGKFQNDTWHWHLSNTHNMSVGGLLFFSDVPYLVGDVIELEVVMSGVLNVFKGFGKVLRVEQKNPRAAYYSIAVKFVMTPAIKAKRSSQSAKN